MAAPSTTTGASQSAPNQSQNRNKTQTIDYRQVWNELLTRTASLKQHVDLQRVWGASHVGFASLVLVFWVAGLFFGSASILSAISYRLATLALVIGYGVAVRRHVGPAYAVDMATLERALSYDGAPYLCLALTLFMTSSRPAVWTLLCPLLVYSIYHGIAWVKSDEGIKARQEYKLYVEPLCRNLSVYQSTGLFLSAHLEIASLPYTVLVWMVSQQTGKPSLAQIIILTQFLRWQYTVSPKIKAAWRQWEMAYQDCLQHPSCPKQVRAFDKYVRDVILKPYATGTNTTRPHHPVNANMNRSNSRGFPGAGNSKKSN